MVCHPASPDTGFIVLWLSIGAGIGAIVMRVLTWLETRPPPT